MKAKFPSLYTIIKKGDLITLCQYFEANQDTSTTVKLVAGKQLSLFDQALVFNQTNIVYFLIDRTPPKKLNELLNFIIHNLKSNNNSNGNPHYNYYCERVFNLIEETGLIELKIVLEHMLIKLCTCGFMVHENLIIDLMNNRLLDFKNKLSDPVFKWNFELAIINAPTRIYEIIIKYYQDNQLNIAQLFGIYLLEIHEKHDSIIKLFKFINLKTKVKINLNSDIHVQISTLFVVSGTQCKLTNLLDNDNFELELIETIKNIRLRDNCYHYNSQFMFIQIIRAYHKKTHGSYYSYSSLLNDKMLNYLKLFSPKLSNIFWNFLLDINTSCLVNHKSDEKIIFQMINL